MTPAARVALEAAVHDGTPGDVDFYRAACAGAGTVLELGCGTGRVAGALGASVTGLDIAPAPLAVAAAAGVRVLRADMRCFHLGGRFERVIIPFSGLYCLLVDSDVVRCLASAREHLTEHGRVVFDCYGADGFHAQPGEPGEGEGEFDAEDLVAEVEFDGRRWRVHERSRWWRERQRIDAHYRFECESGETFRRCIRQRYLLGAQLAGLTARAGLRLVSLAGGFEAEPWSTESPIIVAQAAR